MTLKPSHGQRPSYAQDLVELAQQELAAGRVGRRDFVRLMSALGLGAGAASLAGGRPAFAETKEITVANFGGDALAAWATAWANPFTKATGISVHLDGSGPLPSNIKQQVQANNVIWDVSDGDGYYGIQLGDAGFLDPIDYTIVDKSKVWPSFIWPYGVCDYVYSYVLAYDTTKVKGVPTWADFFDLKKYPGKRATWKYFMGTGEPILLADGVAPDKLYPMDMDRVIAKAKTLGDNLLLWDSGASSQQMFMDSEVTMACIWNTRASVLKRDTKGRVDYTFNQGIRTSGAMTIPKGVKDPKASNMFIASCQDPARQLVLLKLLGNGPANPAASKMATGELAAMDPSSPANIGVQINRDEEWYAKHYDDAVGQWLDAMSG
jgi:putative spermidine/putrescine transport system substrate-binding protein